MNSAIITQQGQAIAIQTPYDADFVAALKSGIAWQSRKWDQDSKCWLVSEAVAEKAIAIVGQFFGVQDHRGKSAAESAAAQVKADQRFILEQEEWIDQTIDALNLEIGRRSLTSKSPGKARYDRSLLRRSLKDARRPMGQMTELRTQKLAEAVRLVRSKIDE